MDGTELNKGKAQRVGEGWKIKASLVGEGRLGQREAWPVISF